LKINNKTGKNSLTIYYILIMGVGSSILLDECPIRKGNGIHDNSKNGISMNDNMANGVREYDISIISANQASHYLTTALSDIPTSLQGEEAKKYLTEILEDARKLKTDLNYHNNSVLEMEENLRVMDIMCQNIGFGTGHIEEVDKMSLSETTDRDLLQDFSDLGAKRFKVWQNKFDNNASVKDESWMKFRCRDNMLRSEENRKKHDLYDEFILGNTVERKGQGFGKFYERLAQASLGREKIRSLVDGIEKYQNNILDNIINLSKDESYEGNLIILEDKVQLFLNMIATAGNEKLKSKRDAVMRCTAISDDGAWKNLQFWKKNGQCQTVLDEFVQALREFYKDIFDFIRLMLNSLIVLDRQLEIIRDLGVEYVSMNKYSLYVEQELITLTDRSRKLISKICAKAVQILNQAERTDSKQMQELKNKVSKLIMKTASNEKQVNALQQYIFDALDGIRRLGVDKEQKDWAISKIESLGISDADSACAINKIV